MLGRAHLSVFLWVVSLIIGTVPNLSFAQKKGLPKKLSTAFRFITVPTPPTTGYHTAYPSPDGQAFYFIDPGVYYRFKNGKLISQHSVPNPENRRIISYLPNGSLLSSYEDDIDGDRRNYSCTLEKWTPGLDSWEVLYSTGPHFGCTVSNAVVAPDNTIAFIINYYVSEFHSPMDTGQIIRIFPNGSVTSIDIETFKKPVRSLRYFGNELRMLQDDIVEEIAREYRVNASSLQELKIIDGVYAFYHTDGSIQYNNLDTFILGTNGKLKYKMTHSLITNKNGYSGHESAIYAPNKRKAFGSKCIVSLASTLGQAFLVGFGEDSFAYGLNQDPETLEIKWFAFNYKKTLEAFHKNNYKCNAKN